MEESGLMRKRGLGKIFTPQQTASFMVSKLEPLKGKIILEPCSGDGIFIKELIKRGVPPEKITACDLDSEFVEVYHKLGVNFSINDFLLSDVKQQFSISPFERAIGNPPYLSRHSIYIQKNKEKLRHEFKEIGVFDTYTLFLYKSLLSLKDGGLLCFITSDTFLTLGYHKKIREFILKNTKVKEIISAPNNLFSSQGVSVSPCIIVLEKNRNVDENTRNIVNYVGRLNSEEEYFDPKRTVKIPQKLFLEVENYPVSININDYTVRLLNSPTKLAEVLQGHIGLHTHDNKRYLAIIEESTLASKWQGKGRKLIPRNLVNSGKWRFYLRCGGEQRYWREIEEAIDWSEEAIKNYDIPKEPLFGKEGIVISGVSRRLAARYMPPGCLWDTNKAMGFVVRGKDLSIYYMLGVLNSKLYTYLIKGILNMTNCVQIDDIRRLPFIYPTSQTKAEIEMLVFNIIENLKKDQSYDYSAEQNRIDELIFSLYETPQSLIERIGQQKI